MDYCARLKHVERCCTTSVKSPVVSHYPFDNYIRQLVDLFTALRSVRHEVDASAKAVSVQKWLPSSVCNNSYQLRIQSTCCKVLIPVLNPRVDGSRPRTITNKSIDRKINENESRSFCWPQYIFHVCAYLFSLIFASKRLDDMRVCSVRRPYHLGRFVRSERSERSCQSFTLCGGCKVGTHEECSNTDEPVCQSYLKVVAKNGIPT